MLKVADLVVGQKYRALGTGSYFSSFKIMAKEELKDGRILLITKFPYLSPERQSLIIWEYYDPDQYMAWEATQ